MSARPRKPGPSEPVPAVPNEAVAGYAAVVVNTPVNRAGGYTPQGDTFTYTVPTSLVDQLAVGHLVWVPFAGRRLQGIVVARPAEPPPGVTLRPLESLAYPEPQLTPTQIELAQWMSQRYLAPLRDCLLLMLPGGVAQRVDVVLARQGGGPLPDDLTDVQRTLLERLTRGDAAQRLLKRENAAWTTHAVLQPLLTRGLVARRNAVTSPSVRPKQQTIVTLTAGQATIDAILPTLGRQSKQADALDLLARQVPPQLSLEQLQKLAACGRGPIQALATAGLVTLVPAQGTQPGTVALKLPLSAVRDQLIALRHAEKYLRVVTALQAGGGRLPADQVTAMAGADLATLRELAQAGLLAIEQVQVIRDPLHGRTFTNQVAPALLPAQRAAWETLRHALDTDQASFVGAANSRFFLLHGVTGSGKTEVYLQAIAHTLVHGRQAIVLVPEIALTPQTIERFAGRFPGQVAIWHSELSPGERFDTWQRMRRGELAIAIGPRSALFAPFERLGIIIIDEEHDTSYKEHDRPPRYHARAVALRLSQLSSAPVVLGSATPALETFYAVQQGRIQLLSLPDRIMGHQPAGQPTATTGPGPATTTTNTIDLPDVQIVDLRQELRAGNRSLLSRALQEALAQTLGSGEQAILFLNRRGSATTVLCRDCGYVAQCARCELPLTYHGPLEPDDTPFTPYLLCHHCNRRQPIPTVCPKCASVRIRHLGAGTQRIEKLVQDLYPQARTLRWDRDTTQHKGAHDEIMRHFAAHEANVLIGTQMIAKGLDLPLVTLVGIVSADIGLYVPDFRAAEHTFQILAQVAGRAGRSARGGRVIVQTYNPEHYAIRAASQHDFLGFFTRELAFRRQLDYPPFSRLVRLVYSHSNAGQAEAEARRVAVQVNQEIRRQQLSGLGVVGPAPCFMARLRGRYRWQIIVRGRSGEASAAVRQLRLPPGWQIDVDPQNLL